MLVATTSGRHWHVIDAVGPCLYGEVLRAVEVVRSPFTGEWSQQSPGTFAIKVCVCDVAAAAAGFCL